MTAPVRLARPLPPETIDLAADRVRDDVWRDWREGLLSTGERDRDFAIIRRWRDHEHRRAEWFAAQARHAKSA